MNQYLFLLKGKMVLDYSPEKLQQRLNEYREWVDTIEEHFVSANRLEHSGVHIIDREQIKRDGPFLESKEIIAGYIIIKAHTQEQATSIASDCPLLKYFEIFVRPVAV